MVSEDEVNLLRFENIALKDELRTYRDAARLYGIDPETMLTLAKSQIKTCADNIRLVEKMQEVLSLFKYIPQDLTEQDVSCAITCYDGNNEMPYCDLVYAGLSVLQKYLKKRSEYDEWRKGNLLEGF